MSDKLKIILSTPYDGLDDNWIKHQRKFESELAATLNDASVDEFEIEHSDHGLGADLPTIGIVLLAANLFFLIPEFHQRVKNAISGWNEIFSGIKKILAVFPAQFPVVGLSDEILFLFAIEHVANKWKVNGGDLVLLGINGQLPKEFRPLAKEVNKTVMFSFQLDDDLYQVAVDEIGTTVWDQKLRLSD